MSEVVPLDLGIGKRAAKYDAKEDGIAETLRKMSAQMAAQNEALQELIRREEERAELHDHGGDGVFVKSIQTLASFADSRLSSGANDVAAGAAVEDWHSCASRERDVLWVPHRSRGNKRN